MTYQSIKEWPAGERPRERLLSHGPSSMTDAQLLAIILRTGSGGRSAIDLARELLDTFGSLMELERAALGEISKVKGIGTAKAAQIRAAAELGRRMFREPLRKGAAFTAGRDVHSYMYTMLRGLQQEVFFCLLLDAKNRLIPEVREITKGTLTSSLIHPREAFRDAIRESAASVIFVHNHPSGDPSPSREDIIITERLSAAGDTLGIKVLDHVIVADAGFTSMLEKGYLKAG